ncbi:hypothetical protein XELAEV_18014501mg [Xenopus laevis]|uniref:Phosphodiesterase n=2 Tax=Xenopus laevis TaxID=8355 RepID=A0A974DGW8_XENLA|nr:hypothetical protein XELAEV_18014501mg [Xenopus laevis]
MPGAHQDPLGRGPTLQTIIPSNVSNGSGGVAVRVESATLPRQPADNLPPPPNIQIWVADSGPVDQFGSLSVSVWGLIMGLPVRYVADDDRAGLTFPFQSRATSVSVALRPLSTYSSNVSDPGAGSAAGPPTPLQMQFAVRLHIGMIVWRAPRGTLAEHSLDIGCILATLLLDTVCILAAYWLDTEWILYGYWQDSGLTMAGYWLHTGWILAGSCMDTGWILVGYWLDTEKLVIQSVTQRREQCQSVTAVQENSGVRMDSDMKQSSETPSNIPTSKSNQQITQPSEETRKALKQPTFNVWGMERKQMLCLLEQMFYELDLVTEFKMEPETVRCFLTSVQKHYQENPFHNFYHGFSVTQMMYCVISQCQLQEHLSHIDILTLMVAALCHDLDHPGLSNSYQVNAQTDLARQYHNKSPLENHHWAVAWRILSQKQSNLLLGADPKQVPHIQQEIMELILATDMAHHGEILQTLQNIENFNFSNREHVTALKKGLIKICDISNEARPAEQAEIWADALMEEYFLQSDREKDEGLPVTPYMDRDKVKKADAQSSFISFLLIPLCEALCKHFPLLNNLLLQPLRAARLRYQQQMDNGMLERQDM